MFNTYEATFNQRAGSYQAAMEAFPQARSREFLSVVEPLDLKPGQIVCDLPSGGGYLHRYLPRGVGYLAVEPVRDFLTHCPTGPGFDAVLSPIESVPRPNHCVDHLVSLAGLHHCPDLSVVFAEMKRLVRPGGLVVIADVEAGTRPGAFLNGYVADNNPMGHDGRFLDRATASCLRDAGLEPIDDQLVDIPWVFEDAHQAGWYCAGLFGIEGRSPQAVAEALAGSVGASKTADAFTIHWALRRLVCIA